MPRKRKSDQQSTDSTTAVAEPPAVEATPVDQCFAAKVGQKTWVALPDPFAIATDNDIGMRLFESKRDRQMAIKFGEGRLEDKPSQPVIDKLREAGFRWNPSDKIWATPVRGESAMRTRIDAERLYQELCQMVRQDKGIEPGPGIPF
jgi:hypothetical protein